MIVQEFFPKNIIKLTHFFVPVENVGSSLYHIVSIMKETAQKQ